MGLEQDGTILSWNPAAARMYGFEESEVLGQRFFDLVAPERADSLTAVLQGLKSGHFREEDAIHQARDGSAIPVSITVSAIPTPAGRARMVAVVVRDLTERKLLELELIQSQKMEAVGRLAGGIAHDFNNILTVILGQSDVIIDDLSNERRAQIQDVSSIQEAASPPPRRSRVSCSPSAGSSSCGRDLSRWTSRSKR